ncbi:MAG: PAS domain S-box protein [Euryarchaeota archaeon]|nr:PAS domain S-box protein [Euryarchaeota archaeon]
MIERLNILLIEDNPGDARLIQELLSEDTFIHIDTVERLSTGLEYLDEEKIDALLLDLSLPDSHGLETFNRVQDCFPRLPILILTGLDDNELASEAVRKGAQDYLVKGQIDSKLLIGAIKYAIERKKLERALQESERKYRLLSENSSDVIWSMDFDGKFQYISPSTERLSGFTAEEVLNLRLDQILMPEGIALFEREIALVLQSLQEDPKFKVNRIFELEQQCKDGSTVWTEVSASIMRDEDGNPTGIQGVTRDIAERKQISERLRESEHFLRTLIDSMDEGVMVIGTDYKIRDVNKAITDKFGFAKENVIGKHCYEISHQRDSPCEPPQDRCPLKCVLETRNFCKEIHTHYTASGEPKFLELSASPMLDEHGEITSVIEVSRDITERRKAERALQESERKYRLLSENFSDVIWTMDFDGRFQYVSPSVEKLRGYTVDEAMSQDIYQVLMPEGIALFEREMAELLQSLQDGTELPESKIFELEQPCKDGSTVWAESSVSLMYDETGTSMGIQGISRDVTERKKAEEALRESEEKYRTLIQGTHEIIQSVALDGKFLFVNKTWHDLLGYSEEELKQITLFDIIHPDSLEHCSQLFNEVISGKSLTQIEAKFKTKEGSTIYVEGNVIPRYSKGRLTGTQGFFRDITERKKVEDALKSSQSQLTEAMNIAHLVDWEFDVATGIFTFDDRFYALYGTTAELEGGNRMPAGVYAKEFVHPDDVCVVADETNKAIQATDPGYVSQVEHRIIRRDGEIRHIVVRIGITKDENGRTIKAHGANQDITERKKMEDALRENEDRLRTFYENTTIGIYRTTPDGRILMANPAHLKLLGYSSFEELSKRNREVDGYEPGYSRQMFKETIEREGRFIGHEAQWKKRDGTVIWVRENAVLFRNKDGKVDFYEGTLEDITERKKMEDAIKVNLHDLERYKKATIDRELKMIELKERIKLLEQNGGVS